MFGRVPLRSMNDRTSAAIRISTCALSLNFRFASGSTGTVAESDKVGGFQLTAEEHRQSC